VKEELTIRIAGEAGQGVLTIGNSLCRILRKAGFAIFSHMDYMSRIRGGNNFFQIRVGTSPVSTPREKADILVALDKESIGLHKSDCHDKAMIIADMDKFNIDAKDDAITDLPLYEIARSGGGSEKYINIVASGFVSGTIGIPFDMVEKTMQTVFRKKGEDIILKNISAAYKGYQYAEKHGSIENYKLKPPAYREELLLNGNQAIALGVIKAGCKLYSAYPMTPSTSIMNTIAHYADEYGIIVEQAEDEIAAVNMAIGASFAGVRSMAGTSGGGFALMGEGISLAGMTETPVVIVDSQRPGPATGLPTRTEQGDLDFLIHAGHGEFTRAVFSPGTIEQCFYLTIKAFQVADTYQIPVIIMTDQFLADSLQNVPLFDMEKIQVESKRISQSASQQIREYKRYRLTENGISPRAVPSWITDVIYADSDEHTEEGHITESAEVRREMVEKRFIKKYRELQKDIEAPSIHNVDNAQTIILCFGSTYHVVKEVCEHMETKKIGFMHLSQVWPFPVEKITTILKGKKVLTVENNAGAQLAGLLLRETGIRADDSILKYDGRPFNLDELMREVERRIRT
jgi:2-oxoglutarate ferredoxin oxidoreductase subunit alpha